MYDRVDYGTLGLYMAITGVLAPLMNGSSIMVSYCLTTTPKLMPLPVS